MTVEYSQKYVITRTTKLYAIAVNKKYDNDTVKLRREIDNGDMVSPVKIERFSTTYYKLYKD